MKRVTNDKGLKNRNFSRHRHAGVCKQLYLLIISKFKKSYQLNEYSFYFIIVLYLYNCMKGGTDTHRYIH